MIHITISDNVLEIISERLQKWIISPNPFFNSSTGPWFIINRLTSDDSVGWPGDKIAGPFDTKEEAHLGYARALLEKLEE